MWSDEVVSPLTARGRYDFLPARSDEVTLLTSRAAAYTLAAPASKSAETRAFPRPRLEPVTRATLPWIFMTHLPFIDATFRQAGIRHSRVAIDEKSEAGLRSGRRSIPTPRPPDERRMERDAEDAVGQERRSDPEVGDDDPGGQVADGGPTAEREGVETRHATPDPGVDGALKDRVGGGVARHHRRADDEEEHQFDPEQPPERRRHDERAQAERGEVRKDLPTTVGLEGQHGRSTEEPSEAEDREGTAK